MICLQKGVSFGSSRRNPLQDCRQGIFLCEVFKAVVQAQPVVCPGRHENQDGIGVFHHNPIAGGIHGAALRNDFNHLGKLKAVGCVITRPPGHGDGVALSCDHRPPLRRLHRNPVGQFAVLISCKDDGHDVVRVTDEVLPPIPHTIQHILHTGDSLVEIKAPAVFAVTVLAAADRFARQTVHQLGNLAAVRCTAAAVFQNFQLVIPVAHRLGQFESLGFMPSGESNIGLAVQQSEVLVVVGTVQLP